MIEKPANGEFRFGEFRYESATGRLFAGGEDLGVPPRAAALLEYLLERAGDVCTKEELLAGVWQAVNVGEESLTQAISVLRGALGDDSKSPSWLETIPRRGYRFIGPVEHRPAVMTSGSAGTTFFGRWGALGWTLAAIGTVVAATSLAGWGDEPGAVAAAHAPVRFVIDLGADPMKASHGIPMGLSPDGTSLVISRPDRLYLRRLASEELVPIVDSYASGTPYFSPDGREIAFYSRNALKRLALDGGPPTTIANSRGPRGAFWGHDGLLVYARGPHGIYRVPVEGGEPERIVEVEPGESVRSVQPLPGGGSLLYALNTDGGDWNEARIVVERLATGERHTLLRGFEPRYAPTGHLVFARNGALWAVAFDHHTATTRGEPEAVVAQVLQSSVAGAAYYSLSLTGVLAYLQGAIGEARRPLVWLAPDGTETEIVRREILDNPRLSPDERRVAAVGAANDDSAIWVHELGRGWTLLTTDGEGTNPIWSHDGSAVIFESVRDGAGGIWRRGLDFAAPAELLWRAPSPRAVAPESVSADGRFLYFTSIDAGHADVWVLDLTEARVAEPIAALATPGADEGSALIHPSGDLLLYVSNESGRPEVYLREMLDERTAGRRWQVSHDGGDEPRWSHDGNAIYYRVEEQFIAVDIDRGSEPTFGEPRVVLESQLVEPPGARTEYDVAADGRILVTGLSGIDVSLFSRIHVVINWFEELAQRVPAG